MFIVDIMGGYGNQLFQICFALFLKKHGFNPKLYAFKNNNYDDHNFYIINEKNFGLKSFNPLSERIITKIKKNKSLDEKYFSIIKSGGVINKDQIKEIKNIKFKNNKLVTSFNGFWQDKNMVDEIYEEFYKGIRKTTSINNSLNLPITKGSTMLHIRRGDHQEYLPIKYYSDSIDAASSDIENFNLDIFTDDKDWVESQPEFKNASNIYGPSSEFQTGEETIKTFSKMLNYENFIISNSTYSWWPARIAGTKDSSIYYPYPHWVNYQPDIYYENWIKIER